MTADDMAATLFFCVLVPLVGLAVLLALLPVYLDIAAWVLHLCGAV